MSCLTPEELDELRRLAEAATPGPWNLDGPWWYADDDCTYCISSSEETGRITVAIAPPKWAPGGNTEVRDANIAFIRGASPEVVLRLIRQASSDQLRQGL